MTKGDPMKYVIPPTAITELPACKEEYKGEGGANQLGTHASSSESSNGSPNAYKQIDNLKIEMCALKLECNLHKLEPSETMEQQALTKATPSIKEESEERTKRDQRYKNHARSCSSADAVMQKFMKKEEEMEEDQDGDEDYEYEGEEGVGESNRSFGEYSRRHGRVKGCRLTKSEDFQADVEDDLYSFSEHEDEPTHLTPEETEAGTEARSKELVFNNLGGENGSGPHYAPANMTKEQKIRRVKSEGKKNRKIRTTITKEKLAEMNRIFGEYMAHKDDGKNPKYNLKEIGIQLQLGYSTILHKYREYRANKKVKGGALIASLQKKRKYRKSVEIERIIELALADRAFFTAVQLSNYIYARYQRAFSRSIISRHLGEMGYSYKNLKSTPMQKNKPKYKDCRQQYALIMNEIANANSFVFYVDELALNLGTCSKKKIDGKETRRSEDVTQEYVSLLVAASADQMIYVETKHGFFTREDFMRAMNRIHYLLEKQLQAKGNLQGVVVHDLNRIHLDPEDEEPQIANLFQSLHFRRVFLPPCSPQLNPLESLFCNMRNRISKKEITVLDDLKREMEVYVRSLENESIEVHFKELPQWLEKSKNRENF